LVLAVCVYAICKPAAYYNGRIRLIYGISRRGIRFHAGHLAHPGGPRRRQMAEKDIYLRRQLVRGPGAALYAGI
jgi:hypothetical protein